MAWVKVHGVPQEFQPPMRGRKQQPGACSGRGCGFQPPMRGRKIAPSGSLHRQPAGGFSRP